MVYASPTPNQTILARPLDVLVIDDHPPSRLLFETVIRAFGHRARLAASGEEGVRAAMAHAYDLILMDIAMPGMDSLETARRIRAVSPARAAAPIVAVTASVRAGLADAVAEAGMDAYLLKPIDFARLARTMALLTKGSVDAAERDEVHQQDDHQEPDNDAHRTHAMPRA